VQEHAFNTPFQLGHLGLLPHADTVGMGLGYSLGLAPGDVLVAGSDGLFDNMWDDQLEQLVERGLR
jgi:protein phosphatase PTC7